jgi:regulatory protein
MNRKNTEPLEAARRVALRYLGYAARTRKEIEERLEKAAFAPEVIAAVVSEMESRGWLDDTHFARAWVEDRADRKRYGKTRLAAELRRKGVDKETIAETLETIEEADELARALTAAQTRLRSERLAEADPAALQTEKRRLSDFLLRRGFSHSIIRQVFSRLQTGSLTD